MRGLKFRPEDGLHITVRGSLGVYEPRGEYQVYVSHIGPVGLGALQLAFEQLEKKLQDEGLFDEARKKPLPILPRCIGVITSPTGAAIRDILRVLKRRFANVHVQLYPVKVQGEGAAAEIVAALRYFGRAKIADVLIVARGGGSLVEDLWAFNEEIVARAIAASRDSRDHGRRPRDGFHDRGFRGRSSRAHAFGCGGNRGAVAAGIRTPYRRALPRTSSSRCATCFPSGGIACATCRPITRIPPPRDPHAAPPPAARRAFFIARRRAASSAGRVAPTNDEGRHANCVFRFARTRGRIAAAHRAAAGKPSFPRSNVWSRASSAGSRSRACDSLRSTCAHEWTKKRRIFEQRLTDFRDDGRALFAKRGVLRPPLTASRTEPLNLLQRGYAIAYDASGKVLRSSDQVGVGDDISVRLARGQIDATVRPKKVR